MESIKILMKLFDSAIGKTVTTKPKRFRALASRCGVFPYLINGNLVWQYRPEEEVFNQDSIDSLLDANITIGHPEDDEDLSESHGTIYNSESINNDENESGVYADFVVFTDEARDLSSNGIPVSPMYDTLLIEKQGDFDGKPYNFIQTNIRYSSLGLVSKARQETTKVFYQISKDSGLLIPDKSLLEIPVISCNESINELTMKTKLSTDLAPPLVPKTNKDSVVPESETLETPDTQEITQEIIDSENLPLETPNNQEISTETPDTQEVSTETPELPASNENNSTETPTEKPAIAEFNSSGGINVNKDYLDDAIDVAKRASDMGLLTFNEAMQYSLSSLDTLMRMILLKEGVELDRWEDACGAYKVYMKLRPLSPTATVTNSDSIGSQPKPLVPALPSLPKINHPLHQKPSIQQQPSQTIKTFDDLE